MNRSSTQASHLGSLRKRTTDGPLAAKELGADPARMRSETRILLPKRRLCGERMVKSFAANWRIFVPSARRINRLFSVLFKLILDPYGY